MFYGSEIGDRLVNENNYPDGIRKYLAEESKILVNTMENKDVLIEVGCMEARNMAYAINNDKKYIGIDIISEYIETANEIIKRRNLQDNCEFLCMNAENLDKILTESKLLKQSKTPLFFFPFNSFGNMKNCENVLNGIKGIKNARFLVFSYNTDKQSNQERFKYYSNCNYDNLQMTIEEYGTRFSADNGLDSIAYHEEYLSSIIKRLGLNLETKSFADIRFSLFYRYI